MSNPIFVFEGIKDAALTTSIVAATGYPVTNLQDDRYATLWRSNAATHQQTLSMTWSIAKNKTSLFIANHNLALLGLTYLNLEVFFEEEWRLNTEMATFPDPLYIAIDEGSDLDWRLKFVKSSALSAAPQIGMLYFGVEAQMPLYSNSPERGLQCDAIVAESMSKLRYSSSMGADRESWKLDFGRLTALEAYNFARLVRAVNGIQFPFWFCDMDGNWHFVRFKKNYLPLIGRGNVIFAARGIEFDEERVGIAQSLPGGYTVLAPA